MMDDINKKLDGIQEDIGEIKTHLAVYNAQLKIHIKRSELLEQKLEPIENHVQMLRGVFKFLGILAAVAAIAEFFKH